MYYGTTHTLRQRIHKVKVRGCGDKLADNIADESSSSSRVVAWEAGVCDAM